MEINGLLGEFAAWAAVLAGIVLIGFLPPVLIEFGRDLRRKRDARNG